MCGYKSNFIKGFFIKNEVIFKFYLVSTLLVFLHDFLVIPIMNPLSWFMISYSYFPLLY